MKLYKFILPMSLLVMLSCSDKYAEDLRGPSHDITFNEYELDRFSFKIFNAPFQSGDNESGIVTLNAEVQNGELIGGFVLSNKNWRSFPWCLSEDFGAATATEKQKKAALDSCRFSVYTARGNATRTYAVAKTDNGKAFFTLKTPHVVEHILVANTTYNYLLMVYSSYYSSNLDAVTQWFKPLKKDGTKAKVSNPKIPETTAQGRFTLPTPDNNPLMHLTGVTNLVKLQAGKAAAQAARDQGKSKAEIYADSTAATAAAGAGWFKLIIKGYLDNKLTGTIDYYMGARKNAVAAFPKLNTIKDDWYKVDLSSLGKVDKVLFELDSSDKDGEGKMRHPAYFCLDGIRLRK